MTNIRSTAAVLALTAFSAVAVAGSEQHATTAAGATAASAEAGTAPLHGDIMPDWERGKLMNKVIDQEALSQPEVDLAAQPPRVTVYFDRHGTEPGLPPDLGNTQQGRSIMLKYLEQARQEADS